MTLRNDRSPDSYDQVPQDDALAAQHSETTPPQPATFAPLGTTSPADAATALPAGAATALPAGTGIGLPARAEVVLPAGATVVVTGGTSGLGREVVRRLAGDGYRVITVGRDPTRVEALRMQRGTAGPRNVVIATVGDLSTAAGCRSFAEFVAAQTDHVAALINNAGVMSPRRVETADGLELNFAVHHLAPFVLTNALLPLLRRFPAARVVNVNSAGHQTSLGGHHNPTLDFDDLQSRRGYDPFLAYSRSKLANLLFTYELARRHGTELVVNALHPGVVRTDLGRQWPRLQVAAMQVFALSSARAAGPVASLAIGPVATQGAYYDRSTPVRSSPPSYDRNAASRLWQLTEALSG